MYSSSYYDINLNKCKIKIRTSLRFWKNEGWIKETDPDGWFQWCSRHFLRRRSSDNFRQRNRWKQIVSRFKSKLVKTIKDSGSKFDDYSVSPKMRLILLHRAYELKKRRFVVIFPY